MQSVIMIIQFRISQMVLYFFLRKLVDAALLEGVIEWVGAYKIILNGPTIRMCCEIIVSKDIHQIVSMKVQIILYNKPLGEKMSQ